MARSATPHLMFEGNADEAMHFYVSLFPGSEVTQVERYGPGELGAEGTVKVATFVVAGQALQCADSPVPHAFTFTPSISLFVECEDEREQETAFARLAEDGEVKMALDDHGFSSRFGWVQDRFGVSWQLNLA